MDAVLYINQNANEACQPEFSKIWRLLIFLFKKLGDYRLSRDIKKSLKKIGIKAIFGLFESLLSSIEVFWGWFRFIGYLMSGYLSFSRLHKKYVM